MKEKRGDGRPYALICENIRTLELLWDQELKALNIKLSIVSLLHVSLKFMTPSESEGESQIFI